MTDVTARDQALELLARRGPGKTICPSEVAKALVARSGDTLTATNWRPMMPGVHAAVDKLLGDALVVLSWKGETMPSRSGPYRIGLASKTKGL